MNGLLIILTTFSFWTSGLSGECRTTEYQRQRSVVLGCHLVRHTAVVRHSTNPRFRIRLSAVDTTCNRLRLSSWPETLREGLEICRQNQAYRDLPLEMFEMTHQARVLHRWRGLVSYETTESGYTGGVHGYAMITRRTLDKNGKIQRISTCFPRRQQAILRLARRKFKRLNREGLYRFDALAFGLFPGRRKTTIRFAFPHQIEVARGTTLSVTLVVPSSPRCGRRIR